MVYYLLSTVYGYLGFLPSLANRTILFGFRRSFVTGRHTTVCQFSHFPSLPSADKQQGCNKVSRWKIHTSLWNHENRCTCSTNFPTKSITWCYVFENLLLIHSWKLTQHWNKSHNSQQKSECIDAIPRTHHTLQLCTKQLNTDHSVKQSQNFMTSFARKTCIIHNLSIQFCFVKRKYISNPPGYDDSLETQTLISARVRRLLETVTHAWIPTTH